ncbi:MAG TPA: Hsp20/alpha crystallin family protein [Bryobacteraceae bacterium]|nr:Hsp20/alpha crystallin family protein [Bryobacteraceae bacterium]
MPDPENHKLVLEFAIPGAATDTIDIRILEDRVHLTAPAREIEYVASLALGWPVKPEKAEATYEHGLLRVEAPLADPMENAVRLSRESQRLAQKRLISSLTRVSKRVFDLPTQPVRPKFSMQILKNENADSGLSAHASVRLALGYCAL